MDEDTNHGPVRYCAVRCRLRRRAGRNSGGAGNSHDAQHLDNVNASRRAEPVNYAAGSGNYASKPSHYASKPVDNAE